MEKKMNSRKFNVILVSLLIIAIFISVAYSSYVLGSLSNFLN